MMDVFEFFKGFFYCVKGSVLWCCFVEGSGLCIICDFVDVDIE